MRAYISLVIAVLMFTGCSSSRDTQQTSQPLKSGMAQLIFYYPHSFFWPDKNIDITFGDQSSYGLENKSFLIRDIVPNAKTVISVAVCGATNKSYLTINTTAGKKYYIRVTPANDNTLTGLLAYSNLSEPEQANAVKSTDGPYTLELFDESFALKEMQSLKACTQCT